MEESEVEGSGDLPVGRTVVPEGQGNVDNETTGALSLSNSADTSGGQNESSSNAATPKKDKTETIHCPDCNTELNPREHKFCFGCAKAVQEILSSMVKPGDIPEVIHCPQCNIELDHRKHKFCSGCAKDVQKILSSMLKGGENESSGAGPHADTLSEPELTKVVVTADNVENIKRQVGDIVRGLEDREQLPAQENDDKVMFTEVLQQKENFGMTENLSQKEVTSEPESDEVTASQESSATAANVDELTKAKEQESQANLEMTGNLVEGDTTTETDKNRSDCVEEVIEAKRIYVTPSEQTVITMTNDHVGKGFQVKKSEQVNFQNSPENVQKNTEGKNQCGDENSKENNQLDDQSNEEKDTGSIKQGENIEEKVKKDVKFTDAGKKETFGSVDSSLSEGPGEQSRFEGPLACGDISLNAPGKVTNASEEKKLLGNEKSEENKQIDQQRNVKKSAGAVEQSENEKTSAENNRSKGGVEKNEVTGADSCSGDGPGEQKTLKEIAAGADPLTFKDGEETDSEPLGEFYRKPALNENSCGRRTKGTGNQKKTSGPNTEIKNSKGQKGVTVVFHAILSEKFNRTEDTHIFIRGELPIFHGWDKNSLEVIPVK